MLSTAYVLSKGVHVACAAVSLILFAWRGRLAIRGHAIPRRWMRRIPDSVDSLLMLSGIVLMVITSQYPLHDDWLSLKIIAILVYIALGILALHHSGSRRVRKAAWIAAMLVFTGIVWLAHMRTYVG